MLLNSLSWLCIFCLVMGLTLPTALSLESAPEVGWREEMTAGMQKFESGDYAGAEKFFKAAYKRTKDLDAGDLKRVNSEIALGDLYRKTRRYSEAEPLYKEAMIALDNPKKPQPLIMILNKNAGLYKDQNRFAEAESAYKRALLLAQDMEGADCGLLAETARGLSSLYQKNGQLEQAEHFAFRAGKILSTKVKEQPQDYALSLYELASVQMLQKKARQAIVNLEQALDVLTKTLGPDDLRIACVEDALGTAYFAQKRYPEAEEFSRKALRIYEIKPEKNQMEIAIALSNLGFRLLSQNKLEEAKDCFERSLRMQEKAAAPFEMLASLQGLAEIYARKHDYERCENMLRSILSIKEKYYGKDSVPLISAFLNLSSCLSAQGKKDEGESLRRQAEAIERSIPGDKKDKISSLIQAELMDVWK